jgi:serine protease Do
MSLTRSSLAFAFGLVLAGTASAQQPPAMPDMPTIAPEPPPEAAPSEPGAAPSTPEARRSQGPESVADLAEELLDAVVNISTTQTVSSGSRVPMPEVPPGSPFEEFFDDFFDEDGPGGGGVPQQVQSLGSGFVIDASGIIVTNNHVIQDADEIIANFSDGTALPAELIGRDLKTDLAVLRVTPEHPLTFVEFGDSEAMRVGDWVMAIGNPFGLGGTVTIGIVSARNRDIQSGPYDNFLQTDAAINRGNSGGPLFDMEGRVVGINTAIISPSGGSIGISFAIPTETAEPVIEQLRDYGETRRGWLGVNIQDVTPAIAESLGLPSARGALVASVSEGGPAALAAIEPGDVIVEYDGVTVMNTRQLPRLVANTLVGRSVDVLVLRDGEEVDLQVTIERLAEGEEAAPEDPVEAAPVPETILDLDLGEIDDAARDTYAIDESVSGVLVTAVEPGSDAAEKGIEPGFTIVEVAQQRVDTVEDVLRLVEEMRELGRATALFLVANPAGELRFIALRLD